MIEVNRHTFPNGLRLLHHRDATTQMVALNLLYDVGSRDEVPPRTGLAHLMEHLMFAGSRNARHFDTVLQAAGGDSNAWTSNDVTNYYETLPAHNVETALWLESDRLLSLDLGEENVTTQKSVVIEEFKQRCLNVPYGDLSHLTRSLAYTVHPYRWPTIGRSVDDIEALTRADVEAFYRSHYSVSNLVLCMSGNIDFDRAVALAEKWFGDIEPRPIAPRQPHIEPEPDAPRLLEAGRNVPQNMIVRAYPMVARNHPRYEACDLLSDVLANGMSSRFYRNVVMKTDVFTELDASVLGSYEQGLFLIRGKLGENADFVKAEQIIDDELTLLVEGGVSQYEITKYTNKYQANMLFENIGYAEKAVKLCQYELVMGDARAINSQVDKYRALTPAEMLSTAQWLFAPHRRFTLHYGPALM